MGSRNRPLRFRLSGASIGSGQFQLGEFAEILMRDLGLMVLPASILATRPKKPSLSSSVSCRSLLVLEGVKLADYRHWGEPGIRAQLLDIRTRKLEMDFVIQGDRKSMHVLNAVSPAWTCSIPFAHHVCDTIAGLARN
jgi:hypothetical protein